MIRPLILASKSPRRKELLDLAGLDYQVYCSDADEYFDSTLSKTQAIQAIARQKAEAVFKDHPEALIISADTLVILDDEIMGKAQDKADAVRMLTMLSGKKHYVITAVCLMDQEHIEMFASRTDVYFYDVEPVFIQEYVESGQAVDKAGAYGIQDQGALMIRRIDGDYYTVMGLPIAEVARRIKKIQEN